MVVPFKKVQKYLCTKDIGFIWQNNNVVNNVSSSVNYSEYICGGLPVLSKGSDQLINKNIKKIVSQESQIQLMK